MGGGLRGGRIGFADRAGRASPRAAARLGHSATIDLRWRPIETAPRDGTPILVSNRVRGGVWIARYEERYASGLNRENPWFCLMLNLWWHRDQYASTLPTHWMPLPSPPGDSDFAETTIAALPPFHPAANTAEGQAK